MLLERNNNLKSFSEVQFSLFLFFFLYNALRLKEKDVIIKPSIAEQLNNQLGSHKSYPSTKKTNSFLLL